MVWNLIFCHLVDRHQHFRGTSIFRVTACFFKIPPHPKKPDLNIYQLPSIYSSLPVNPSSPIQHNMAVCSMLKIFCLSVTFKILFSRSCHISNQCMFISLEQKKSWQVSQDLKPKTPKHTTGVVYNKKLHLFILLIIKCYKTLFTWIQENTFFCTFASEKLWGALQSHTKLNVVSTGIFLKNEWRGCLIFR